MSNCKANMESIRGEDGRFLVTTGSTRYKKVQYKGRVMGEQRKVWIIHNGSIPHGFVVHHKNGDRRDNKIENLEAMSYLDHNGIHAHSAWNKGLKRGMNGFDEWHTEALDARRVKKCVICSEVTILKRDFTLKQLAWLYDKSSRQIWDDTQFGGWLI